MLAFLQTFAALARMGGVEEPAPATPAPTADEALIHRLQDGDPSALDALMDRHAAAVINFCANYTGDRAWAEDIAQETFVTVYRKAQSFRSGARALPWIFTIARNRCIDFMRRRGRALPEPPLPDDDPSEGAVAEERDHSVRLALRAMAKKFPLPLVLCEIEEMSYDDAARVVGCSVKTLSSRLARARGKFREALGGRA